MLRTAHAKLLELRDSLRKLRARIRQRPVLGYFPHDKQRRFHADERLIPIFTGSNRGGKTRAIAMDCVDAIEGGGRAAGMPGLERPRWAVKPDLKPPFSIYVVGVSFKKLLQEPEQFGWYLRQMFPADHPMGPPVPDPEGKVYTWFTPLGDITVMFLTGKQDVNQATGGAPKRIYVDEECPLSLFGELHIRLTTNPGAQMLIGATSYEDDRDGPTWMYTDLIAKGIVSPNHPRIGVHLCSMMDNPYVPDERIELMVESLLDRGDADAISARVLGDPTPRAKRPVFDLRALERIWKRRVDSGLEVAAFDIRYDAGMHNSGLPPVISGNPFGMLHVAQRPQPGHTYVIGIDAARGTLKDDFACAQVVCRDTLVQVARFRGHVDPVQFADIVAALGVWYNWALLAPEVIKEGYTVVERLRSWYYYPNIYRGVKNVRGDPIAEGMMGFVPNMHTKRMAIDSLQDCIRTEALWLFDPETYRELRLYDRQGSVEGGTAKLGAPKGMHDDTVTSLAIAVHICVTDDLQNLAWQGNIEAVEYASRQVEERAIPVDDPCLGEIFT